jgi:hypothetical protein
LRKRIRKKMVRTFHKPGRGTAGLITLSILAFLGRMVFDFGVKNQLYILGLANPPVHLLSGLQDVFIPVRGSDLLGRNC